MTNVAWKLKMWEASQRGWWEYIHFRKSSINQYPIYGYAFVPPTPFLLKDWEKYDISRFVDPGCISPEEGFRSVSIDETEIRNQTIEDDLKKLCADENIESAIFLFHSPPYQTKLDRAALDGRMVDHVPMDVNVGSIAIKKLHRIASAFDHFAWSCSREHQNYRKLEGADRPNLGF